METITYTDPNNRTYTYGIECLQNDAVLRTRPLWEEVFSEDSAAFTDYYFRTKAAFNTTFVCRLLSADPPEALQSLEGEIVSMVHLTPYEVTLDGAPVPSFYIVGVATKESHRHRGLMAALLNRAFVCAANRHCPFVFLMPADPAIYKPFGFSYVYSRPEYDVPRLILQKEVYINHFPLGDIKVRCLENAASFAELSQLSEFAGRILAEQFDYYLTRTPSYYQTLLAELASQNGCIYVFTMDGNIEGYFLYAKEEEKPFVQELLFSSKLRRYLGTIRNAAASGTAVSGVTASGTETSGMAAPDTAALFPRERAQKKPVIMAKNLSGSCASPGTDYVNYLASHKGMINELV